MAAKLTAMERIDRLKSNVKTKWELKTRRNQGEMLANSPNSVENGGAPQTPVMPKRFRYFHRYESMFILSVLGVNIRAFTELPYYCLKYGALAFAVPVFLTAFLIVIPIYYYQTAMAQWSGRSAISIWTSVPLLHGLGYMSIMYFLVTMYHEASWAAFVIRYVAQLLFGTMQWVDICLSGAVVISDANVASSAILRYFPCSKGGVGYMAEDYGYKMTEKTENASLPAAQFLHTDVMNLHRMGETDFFSIELIISFMAVVLIAMLMTCRGVSSLAKVCTFLPILSSMAFITIAVRTLLHPYTKTALKVYFMPHDKADFGKFEFWLNGARYSFHSLFISWAVVTTLASRNRYKSITLLPNCILPPICSLVVSFIVAALPACLHHLYATDATYNNAAETALSIQPAMDFTLLFTTVPHGLLHLAPFKMYGTIFYVIIAVQSVIAVAVLLECVVLGLMDSIGEKRRTWKMRIFILLMILIAALCTSLAVAAPFGVLTIRFVYKYGCQLPIVGMALLDVLTIAYCYKVNRLQQDVEMMTGKPSAKMPLQVLLNFVTPIAVLLLLIGSIIGLAMNTNFAMLDTYGDLELSLSSQKYGIAFMAIPFAFLLIAMLPPLATTPGASFIEVVLAAILPESTWHAKHADVDLPDGGVPKILKRGFRMPGKGRNKIHDSQQHLGPHPNGTGKIAATQHAHKTGFIHRGTQVTVDVACQTYGGPNNNASDSEPERERHRDRSSRRHHKSRRHHRDDDERRHSDVGASTSKTVGLPRIEERKHRSKPREDSKSARREERHREREEKDDKLPPLNERIKRTKSAKPSTRQPLDSSQSSTRSRNNVKRSNNKHERMTFHDDTESD